MSNRLYTKLIAIIVVILASLNCFSAVSIYANEMITKTYHLNDLEIQYNIIASWNNEQHISIRLTNIGVNNIENWKLYYDFKGEIYSIWNAEIEIDENNKSYVKCMDYNSVISPNSSVVFGYLISNVNGVPEQIIMSNDNNTDENFNNEAIIYYKDVTSENEIAYDNEGEQYFCNQIIVTASKDAEFEEIEKFSNSISASIVGYIELTNEYQLEFTYDIDFETIENIITEIENNYFIDRASVNYIFNLSEEYIPNDSESNMQGENEINNWNLYAINAPRAWEYYNEMETVKIGLIDGNFYTHDDISFNKIFEKNSNYSYHGTFVAGIMAAEFNNEIGISGVCPKQELYAYAIGNKTSQFKYKTALAKLIHNNVKVINVSMNAFDSVNDVDKKEKINNGDEKERKKFNKKVNAINDTLERAIDKGFDFVIVVAAGNDGEKGYDAKYANYLSNIDTSLKNNIIVVGGMTYQNYEDNESIVNFNDHIFANFSNIGERVDVVAPSVNILSLFPSENYMGGEYTIKSTYKSEKGTSMAAPHVAGIAGMIYSVDPSIPAPFVKAIIVKTSKLRTVFDKFENEYGIADAGLAVSTAYYYNKSDKIIFGKLIDSNDLSKVYSDTELFVTYNQNGLSTTQNIRTDENGKYELVIPKEVNISDLNIKINDYNITQTECLEDFLNSSAVVETKVIPIKSSVIGKVTEYNKTKKTTKPLGGVNASIYKNDSIISSAATQSDGTYRIELNQQGDFIVKFNEDKQVPISIVNGEYTVDAAFEVEDEDEKDKDENHKDDNDKNNDDKENEFREIGENEKINITLNGDGSSDFTGDFSGDLSDGIWLHTFNGSDDYYIRIYITPDTGEYQSTFGAPGWGLYTTRYHYWKYELKIATYKTDGTLIKEQALKKYYDDIYISVPEGYLGPTPSRPLMQTDSINSIIISGSGITYNVHTDGYYKGRYNAIGSLGIRKENWTSDEIHSIGFYNNSKINGILTKDPF